MYIRTVKGSFYWLAILLLTTPISTVGQSVVSNLTMSADENSVQYSLLPLAGYTSDTGLFGGAYFQRLDYGNGSEKPYLSRTRIAGFASFRSEFEILAVHEHTRAFNRELRSLLELELFRSSVSHFFGIGNNTLFSEDLYRDDYFFFLNRSASVNWRLRKTITEYGFNGDFDFFTELKVSYLDASESAENSNFSGYSSTAEGLKGWTNMLGFGLIADDRDNEINPTEGYRYEAGIRASHGSIAGDFDFAFIWGELRNYVEIIQDIVIAHKFRAEHITGNAPFWELSTIGNDDGLRGFHLDRFRGESSLLNIFEARTWLFSIFDGEVRFGGQLFWDSGRVFSENDSPRIFNNWKHSYGVGGAITLFNPDFIVRGDLGFSKETYRIYAGIGYIF